MKICITGGAGMIGSNLALDLVQNNYEVTIIDNLWRGNLANLKFNGDYIVDIDSDFFQIDLSDTQNIEQICSILSNADIVVHLADVVAGIGYVFNKQYEIFTQNILINNNLFKAAAQTKISKLIYVGTACSFPLELQSGLHSELVESALFPAHPESAYGWSKLVGQLELQYLSEVVDFEICTLMLHNVYGPNCEFEGERTQVIPSLISNIVRANEGDTITVWGSGSQGRAFIHVNDVISALKKTFVISDLPPYMQIGPSYCTSIKELAEMLIRISEKNLHIYFDKSKPEGDRGRFANFSLAQKYLEWTPTVDLCMGLQQTYKWIYDRSTR
ncbi:MAG: NAD-dependent epimerase/dehydratase family protein [Deltaproteobacteria bacterium]|nr:NAD-dependent epimerase/dehydratase family protein [Deltaproteobacteria bacterium]